MDREVVWSESAARDLEQIVEYIAHDSEHYAASVGREIVAAARSLAQLAERGRRVPEVADPQIRELIVGSYRLIYRLRDTVVHILTVIHGAREMPSL